MRPNLDVEVPRVFRPLLSPARYKGAYGGRGSGKSHFFGGQVPLQMLRGRNVLCVREIQNSIADSVKRLIEGKIDAYGLAAHFDITEREIRCRPSGAICIFRGMQNHTAASVKSLEDFDVAYWEEAQTASRRSLDLLTPTIRNPGSELWFAWNPENEGDPIERLLRHDPPEGSVVVEANHADNPWFPDELRADMERDRQRDPDKYRHVWAGSYQNRSETRVFRNWRVGEVHVPEDARPFYGADWGFANDPTAAVRFCIPKPGLLYIDREAYEVGCPVERVPALLAQVDGIRDWPCRADSARPETIDYVRRHGFPKMLAARKGKGSVEHGIEFLKGFDIVVHPRCVHAERELTLYSYETDKRTGEILPKIEDANNHCIAEGQRIETARGLVPIEQVTTDDMVMTRAGYRRVLFAGVTDVNRAVVEVATSAGSLICTPDHRVGTKRGFVRADALRYDDEIIIGGEAWSRQLSGAGAFIGAGRARSGKLTVAISSVLSGAVRSICTELFGSGTMARSPMAGTSTIGTAIPGTITRTIWNVSRKMSIGRGILGVRSARRGKESISTAFALLRKTGTAAMRAEPLTAALLPSLIQGFSLNLSHAGIAGLSSCPGRLATSTSFAATNARRLGGAPLAWMTRTGSARSVAQPSARTDTANSRRAAVRVGIVKEHGRSARVYDLTVEGQPEFFAEGLLVHNCIDALRYGAEGRHRRGKAIPAAERIERDDRPRDYQRRSSASAEGWKVV